MRVAIRKADGAGGGHQCSAPERLEWSSHGEIGAGPTRDLAVMGRRPKLDVHPPMGVLSEREAGMFRRRKLRLFLVAGLAIAVSPPVRAQVIQTSVGSVEFLALEKWTPAQIQQRLGYASPDQLHACAADLKKLGFPEAAVVGYSEQGKRYSIVTVVEPQHAAEILYKPGPTRHISLTQGWNNLKNIAKQPAFLEGGILDYGRTVPGAKTDQPWLADGTRQAWWGALSKVRRPIDFENAQRIIRESADRDARAIAAVVLMNFPAEDGAWRSLVSGLRDPDSAVRASALQAVNSLATYHARKVDWRPASADLVSLLHGTNLFAFQFVLKTLTLTQIDNTLAGPILRDGGARLAIAYLRARHHEQYDLAHQFLVQIRGRDLGSDTKLWEQWVARLS